MNVKTGTKTWSAAEQVSSLKPDGVQGMSPQEMEAVLGGSNLGEVLNKAADPNWVDPVKMRKVGNNQLDKDAFFKLMLTQMKHQDPTNPMQSHEMAAQLAQFSSLEQLNNINASIEGLKEAQQPTSNYQALNFIGKKVWGDASKVTRTVGDKYHDVNFDLPADAQKLTAKVKDADGNIVRTLTLKDVKKGANTVSWNGMTEDGVAARPGEYRVSIEAQSSSGSKIAVKTDFEGRITGLNFTPSGPILMVGNQSVKLQDVKKISEPTPEELMMEQMQVSPLGAQGAMKPGAIGAAPMKTAKLEDVPAAEEDTQPKSNIMTDVAMAGGMLNKLAAETAGEG